MPEKTVVLVDSLFPVRTLAEKTERNKAYRLLAKLYASQVNDEYTIMASNYLQKMFNGNYGSFVSKLKNAGIIEGVKTVNSNDSYTPPSYFEALTGDKNSKGICKKMRIAEKFTFNNLYNKLNNNNKNIINNKTIRGHIFSTDFIKDVIITYKPKNKTEEQRQLEYEFKQTVEGLVYDFDKMYDILKSKLSSIKSEDFVYSGDEESIIRVSYMGLNTYPMSVKSAQTSAKSQGAFLFKDDNSYYITTKSFFEQWKKNEIYNSYANCIERLRAGDFKASRNTTNNRLDTNFTNMPSVFVKQIMSDNNLVQVDLANSQFALLAYKIEKEGELDTEDFSLFKDLAYKGKLYDYMADKKGTDRKTAKKGFFEILFDKAGKNSEEKEALRREFPSVVEYTDKYKKTNGYKSFSISLQKQEAEIFIDGVKPIIDQEVGFNLTKHDAVIVKKQDLEKTKNIINRYFEDINFKGKMVTE